MTDWLNSKGRLTIQKRKTGWFSEKKINIDRQIDDALLLAIGAWPALHGAKLQAKQVKDDVLASRTFSDDDDQQVELAGICKPKSLGCYVEKGEHPGWIGGNIFSSTELINWWYVRTKRLRCTGCAHIEKHYRKHQICRVFLCLLSRALDKQKLCRVLH